MAASPHRLWAAGAGTLTLLAFAAAGPDKAAETVWFVLASFIEVAPVIGAGLLLSAWVAASGAGTAVAAVFRGKPVGTIVIASAAGAVTPVCGLTVLPLMTGLLGSGVPLAPVMAFWLSSPVTDPAMFAATWATLGPAFAIGKTLAAFAIGLLAGVATAALAGTDAVRLPLRRAARVPVSECLGSHSSNFELCIWRDGARVQAFKAELLSTSKLVAICLSLAFAAEFLLRDLLPPDLLSTYVGSESAFAVPLAVMVGAPMYLDGYAALPLARGLLDLGMSPGAAMAFLVSGGAVSIWGILAVVPILRIPTLALFMAIAVLGSLAVGYAFEWLWVLLA